MSRRGPARALWPTPKAYAALGAPIEHHSDDLNGLADRLLLRWAVERQKMATPDERRLAWWLLGRIVAEPELLEQLCRMAWTRPGGAA